MYFALIVLNFIIRCLLSIMFLSLRWFGFCWLSSRVNYPLRYFVWIVLLFPRNRHGLCRFGPLHHFIRRYEMLEWMAGVVAG